MMQTVLVIEEEKSSRAMLCAAINEKLPYKTIEIGSESHAAHYLNPENEHERMRVTFQNAIIMRDLCTADGKNYIDDIMTFSLLSDDGNVRKIQELEKEAIQRAIQHYDGCMAEVARRLGIGRSTLYRKISYNRSTETYV